jgi:hypothetical protein
MQRFDNVKFAKQRISVDVDSFDLDDLVEEKEYENAHFERKNFQSSCVVKII